MEGIQSTSIILLGGLVSLILLATTLILSYSFGWASITLACIGSIGFIWLKIFKG